MRWPQSRPRQIAVSFGVAVFIVWLGIGIHSLSQPDKPDKDSESYLDGYRKGKDMISLVGSEVETFNRDGWVEHTCRYAFIQGDNERDFIAGCHDGWHDGYEEWRYHRMHDE